MTFFLLSSFIGKPYGLPACRQVRDLYLMRLQPHDRYYTLARCERDCKSDRYYTLAGCERDCKSDKDLVSTPGSSEKDPRGKYRYYAKI
jgi:hypothetical protein